MTHFLGLALWIGGAASALVLSQSLKPHGVPFRVSAWPLLARVHGLVIAPGAVITVFSGLMMTIRLTNAAGPMGRGLMVMQGSGVLAAVLALFVGLPTATQLGLFARIDGLSSVPPEAGRLMKRQAVASSLSGVLVLMALFFGVVVQ